MFRKYGFQKQAKRLALRGISFRSEPDTVMKEMGFPHKLEVYYDEEGMNRNFLNGNIARHYEVKELPDDFLYRKANNIPDPM